MYPATAAKDTQPTTIKAIAHPGKDYSSGLGLGFGLSPSIKILKGTSLK